MNKFINKALKYALVFNLFLHNLHYCTKYSGECRKAYDQ